MNLTIDDIRKEKKALDEEISELIFEFQKKTGLYVEGIDLFLYPTYTGYSESPQGVSITTKVRI